MDSGCDFTLPRIRQLVRNLLLLHAFHVGDYIVEVRPADRDQLHLAFALRTGLLDICLPHPLNCWICQRLDIGLEHLAPTWISLAIHPVTRPALRGIYRI